MTMQVENEVAPSNIQGSGVFAVDDISEGSLIWRYNSAIDWSYSQEEVDAMSEVENKFIARYAYFDERLGLYILCGDNARFMNHSEDPNTAGVYPEGETGKGYDIATRDIKAGEELLCDYRTFDAEFAKKIPQ